MLPPDEDFRWTLLAFAAVNVILCVLLEDVFVEYVVFRGSRRLARRFAAKWWSSSRKFLAIEKAMRREQGVWPPVMDSRPAVADSDSYDEPSTSSPIDGMAVVECRVVQGEDNVKAAFRQLSEDVS